MNKFIAGITLLHCGGISLAFAVTTSNIIVQVVLSIAVIFCFGIGTTILLWD